MSKLEEHPHDAFLAVFRTGSRKDESDQACISRQDWLLRGRGCDGRGHDGGGKQSGRASLPQTRRGLLAGVMR